MPFANKPSEVWVILEAKTAEALTRLQFETNIRKAKTFSYTAPTFQKGKWACWYQTDLMNDIDFEEFRI